MSNSSPPTSRKSSNRLLWFLTALAIVAILLGLVLPFFQSPPRFAADDITAIEVRVSGRPDPPVTSTDPAAIAAVVEALNAPKMGFAIQREELARITLKRPSGDVELDVLAADGDRLYIWTRCGERQDLWKVDRESLVRALTAAGVTNFPPPP